ncbi:MAG TPA: zf-HC2 domain-containing protein [Acidobacteriota bacterium]|nr:zf-HC2 domain-containing protein [Acidobacteriota bacterium]
MKCINPSEIYLFLEGELSDQRKAEIKSHLDSCPKCRESLEQRKIMLQAITKIPLYKTPPEFSRQVMSNIKPIKSSLSEWLQAGAATVAFISILTFIFLAFSKQGLTELFINLFRSLIHSSQEALIISIKFIKSLSVFINMFIQLIGLFIKNFLSFMPTVSTEFQIGTVFFSILIAVMILFSIKQKLILGEKR